MSTQKLPASKKFTERTTGGCWLTIWAITSSDMRKLAATAPIPISAPLPGRRLPKNTMRKKATAGSDGISHEKRITGASPFQEVDLVDVDRFAVPVDEDHDGQANPDLGGGNGDHEQGEDLAGDLPQVGGERDQVDVDGVQHQLDGHQDQHRVAPGQHPVDAAREQDRPEEQKERQPDGGPDHGTRSLARVAGARSPGPCPFDPSDRKSTRLNSSHRTRSYAVFCLKKKKRISRQSVDWELDAARRAYGQWKKRR